MKFTSTSLSGAYLIEIERSEDERGFFARAYSSHEFAVRGLSLVEAEFSISFNRKKGTLRGMHYQVAPHAEAKLVRCTRGAIHDVIIDLRPQSPSFRQWIATELTGENRAMLYIPMGMAHGFQTLADDSEVFYQMSEQWHPECSRTVRWNDPAFGIAWPEEINVISEKDRAAPDFGDDGQVHFFAGGSAA